MLLDKEVNALAEDLVAFMQKKFGFDRIPRIKFIFDKNNSQKTLGMTGGYDQEAEEISVYALDRHPKDILRSLAHEMLHHVQKCEGMMDGKDMGATANPNYIMHDDFLKAIEADAFERGNICFREWEACKKGDKMMSEAKFNLKESSDWGSPKEIIGGVLSALERQVEWPLTELMDSQQVHELLAPIKNVLNQKLMQIDQEVQMNEIKIPKGKLSKYKKEVSKAGEMVKGDYPENVKWKVASSIAKKAVNVDEVSYEKSKLKKPKLADRDKDGDISDWEKTVADKIESSKEKKEEVQVNEALKNAHNYSTVTRAMPETAAARDEFVFQELMKKFKITK